MMRKKASLACALVIMILFCVEAIAQDRAGEIERLVNKAAQLFQDKGKDYAIRLLNASRGPFRKGELYVFCATLEGVNVAHPAKRALVGRWDMDERDAKGKLFFKEFVEVAKNQGSGWVEYWWIRQGEKEPTLKRAFIRRVPGENLFVGMGYYPKAD